jgi:medium-chain acyl-[acyl-carrier-protein] hydrolase
MSGYPKRTLTAWVRYLLGEEKRAIRLVCFHHGGGGASSFNGWRRLLPLQIGLLRVQLPGREDRMAEPSVGDIGRLIPELVDALAPLCERPAGFYGHSLGAVVAFEAIRELRRRGAPPPLGLFVSGRRAPHLPLSHDAYCLASEIDLIGYLKSMGGLAPALLAKPHWRKALLPVIRNDLMMSDLYVYREEPPLTCPIVYFAAASDPWVKLTEGDAWGAHSSAPFRSRVLPGGHFFEPNEQAALVADIASSLMPHGTCVAPVAGFVQAANIGAPT